MSPPKISTILDHNKYHNAHIHICTVFGDLVLPRASDCGLRWAI
jgi:hypothetical protein